MRFLRFFVIVILMTLFFGSFGAGVGGLVGYAVPSSISAMFGVKHHDIASDPAYARSAEPQPMAMSIGVQKQRSMTSEGAALGAAWGLILGLGLGVIISLVDQLVLVIRYAVAARNNPHPSTITPKA